MGGNIPDGNFLSGNFPGENLPGVILIVGNFPSGSFLGESFPDTVQVEYLKSFQYRRLQWFLCTFEKVSMTLTLTFLYILCSQSEC